MSFTQTRLGLHIFLDEISLRIQSKMKTGSFISLQVIVTALAVEGKFKTHFTWRSSRTPGTTPAFSESQVMVPLNVWAQSRVIDGFVVAQRWGGSAGLHVLCLHVLTNGLMYGTISVFLVAHSWVYICLVAVHHCFVPFYTKGTMDVVVSAVTGGYLISIGHWRDGMILLSRRTLSPLCSGLMIASVEILWGLVGESHRATVCGAVKSTYSTSTNCTCRREITNKVNIHVFSREIKRCELFSHAEFLNKARSSHLNNASQLVTEFMTQTLLNIK